MRILMKKMKISRSKQKIVFHQIFGAFHQNVHTSLNEVKDDFYYDLDRKKMLFLLKEQQIFKVRICENQKT